LLSGSWDCTGRVWSLSTQQAVQTLTGMNNDDVPSNRIHRCSMHCLQAIVMQFGRLHLSMISVVNRK
jgi:hypothetical protein